MYMYKVTIKLNIYPKHLASAVKDLLKEGVRPSKKRILDRVKKELRFTCHYRLSEINPFVKDSREERQCLAIVEKLFPEIIKPAERAKAAGKELEKRKNRKIFHIDRGF